MDECVRINVYDSFRPGQYHLSYVFSIKRNRHRRIYRAIQFSSNIKTWKNDVWQQKYYGFSTIALIIIVYRILSECVFMDVGCGYLCVVYVLLFTANKQTNTRSTIELLSMSIANLTQARNWRNARESAMRMRRFYAN